jgi:lipid-binding SYLF domain-containing protein
MNQTIRNTALVALLFVSSPLAPAAFAGGEDLRAEADKAIKVLQSTDSSLTKRFSSSAGFVVFPSIGKGGAFIGGEYGKGLVYEKGKPVGEATLSEVNVGPQVGAQSFYEVIFFETDEALADFKQSRFEVSGKTSAVLATEGASLDATYRDGVVIFTLPKNGLMAQAAVGGQKFRYKPLN